LPHSRAPAALDRLEQRSDGCAVVPVVPPAQLPLFDESAQPSAKASAAKAAEPKTAEPSRHPWSAAVARCES